MMRIYLKGFTLVELMVVVIIMGILASLSLPIYLHTVEKSRMGEAYQILGALRGVQLRYYDAYLRWTPVLTETDFSGTGVFASDTAYQEKYFSYTYVGSTLNPFIFSAVRAQRMTGPEHENPKDRYQYNIELSLGGVYTKVGNAP